VDALFHVPLEVFKDDKDLGPVLGTQVEEEVVIELFLQRFEVYLAFA